MVKIAVCDDASWIREDTKKKLLDCSFDQNIEMQIDGYEIGELFLEDERKGNEHDLVMMDYDFEGKGQNGIDIIREFRTFQKDTKVIFLSGYEQVVYKSFQVDTFRFLVKPLKKEELKEMLEAWMDAVKKDAILLICVEKETFLIRESRIAYIEGCGKKSILHFSDGQNVLVNNETLSTMEERLSGDVFFRCHKSFLVNLEHVSSHRRTDAKLDSGERILISRGKYKAFCEVIMEYIVQRQRL